MRRIEQTKTIVARLTTDQRGATAIEYALIAGLISIAAIVAMQGMGNTLTESFSNAATIMANT